MGRKAPIGKGKVISTGNRPMADGPGDKVQSQGGIGPRGRIDRGGSNAGKGFRPSGSIVRNDKGSKY